MSGERVLVQTATGEQAGTVVKRWHGPVTGDSYVVNVQSGFLIAPVRDVRRHSESEGT